jgi:hypothetical protein
MMMVIIMMIPETTATKSFLIYGFGYCDIVIRNCIFKMFLGKLGAGIAQSVQRLAAGWTAEGQNFESR